MTDTKWIIIKRLPDEIHPTHEGITSESKPDYVKDEIPMMWIFEVQCEKCGEEMRLKDFSTDGDGLVYQCCDRELRWCDIEIRGEYDNGEISIQSQSTSMIVLIKVGDDIRFIADPIDNTRLGF